MKRRTIFLLACSVIVAAAAGIAARTLMQMRENRHPAYTIVWQSTAYDATGQATPMYTETRYVSSNGNWHSVRQYADGRTEESFAEVGRGVFVKQGDKLHFLSNHMLPPKRVLEGYLKSPDYLRTETVMGQVAAVIKTNNDPDGRFEIFMAPSLNGEIKHIDHGDITIVKEPVSLIFGEPDASLLKMPAPNAPVDYKNYEQLHGARP